MNILVIFHSTDQPLQLDAALRSLFKHCKDAEGDRVKVLYRATNSRLASLYRQLAREHPAADFIRQYGPGRDAAVGTNSVAKHPLDHLLPEGRLLLEGRDYMLVVPDLTIFTRDFSLAFFADCLRRHPDAAGCTFGLSYQSHWCHKRRPRARIPEFKVVDTGAIKYRWADAKGGFATPFHCSTGIYRATDLPPHSRNGEAKNGSAALPLGAFVKLRPTVLCPDEPMIFQVRAGIPSLPASDYLRQSTRPRMAALPNFRFWKRRPEEQSAAPVAGDHIDHLSEAFAAGRRIDLEALESGAKSATRVSLDTASLTSHLNQAVPLVSVVIPCYAQACYLREAVASVVSQSFDDWELIIVNDGSPDDTTDVARRLIRNHPKHRIRLIEQKNSGLSHARNTGIRSARGAYILPLDADDWIAPKMLEFMVPVLLEQPGVGIVYCDLRHFGIVEKTVQAPEYDFRALCHRNGVSYCSLFRREAWETVGGYNRNMIWSYEDREFWIACGEKGFFAKRVPEVLFHYRVKAESMHTHAILRDRENRARIALNHPRLYSTGEVLAARAIWSDPNICLPPASPKVSVIVLTRDCPSGLEKALGSLVNQTFKDFEIVLVNDGGIDVEHVLARPPHDCDLTHIRHAATRGTAASRNTGFRLASGKYVAWLDDQHVFSPEFIESSVDFLDRTHCRVACAARHHCGMMHQNGQSAAGFHDGIPPEEHLPNDTARLVEFGAGTARPQGDGDARNRTGTSRPRPSVVISKSSLQPGSNGAAEHVPIERLVYERAVGIAVGDFNESPDAHADWDYWLRLSYLCRAFENFDSGNHGRQIHPQLHEAGNGCSPAVASFR